MRHQQRIPVHLPDIGVYGDIPVLDKDFDPFDVEILVMEDTQKDESFYEC